jgi:beta-aspartyl-peptidase (threonine type)
MPVRYVLALHGGAGTIAPGSAEEERPYLEALRAALAAGEARLAAGAGALEAAVATVVALEDCPLFNAGRGAVLNAAGEVELDAGVMDGRTLAAGAVAGVRTVRNPVLAALEVLRQGEWVLLGAEGAERLARDKGLAIVDPSYFATARREAQLRAVRERAAGRAVLDHDAALLGTVGAVARDRGGHLAAATSTGGLTNKLPGRIGDSALVGAGVYANDATCAVSSTGTGELFIRACAAYDVHARMRYLGQGVARAARAAIAQSVEPLGGRGGVIALGRGGDLAMPFNSSGMYRAWVREGKPPQAAIFR